MTNLITSIATNVTARMMSSNSQDYAHKTLFQFIHNVVAHLAADTGYKYFHSLSLFLLTNYKAAKSRQEPNLTPTIIHHYLYFVNC